MLYVHLWLSILEMDYIFSEDGKFFFPAQKHADHYGVLAIGGDLSAERLVFAYQNGIFPWYSAGEPITWCCTNPRCVLFPEKLKVSKSMKTLFNGEKFRVTFNHCFEDVMRNCAGIKRRFDGDTWILEEMIEAYTGLHKKGITHSVEVWDGEELVGGLYGVAIGKIFFGESMFSKVSNASKYGFITLVNRLVEDGFVMIDCQQATEHLISLGAETIPLEDFLEILNQNKTLGFKLDLGEK
jgi:leucyl/phenylalanyl-tRNA---protein transferase